MISKIIKTIGVLLICLSFAVAAYGFTLSTFLLPIVLSAFGMIISGFLVYGFGSVISLLQKLVDHQKGNTCPPPYYAYSPNIPKGEPHRVTDVTRKQEDYDDPTDTRPKCKKCGAPLADPSRGPVCASCLYGVPHKAQNNDV